jgi:amino acid adenylation domain-containing protein
VSATTVHGLQDVVREWVLRTPDACAVRDPSTGQELSYLRLWRRAGRFAADLVATGVRPGDVVALAVGRSVDQVVAMLGVLRAGASYLPLDDHAPASRLAGLVRDSGATALVHAGPAPTFAGDLPLLTVTRDDPPDDPPLAARPGGDDPAYLMYTSGSTGRPKGVLVPHRAVLRLVVAPNYCTVNPGDRVANVANPAFDASTFEIWTALAAGATVVVLTVLTEIGLDEWATLIRRERITTMLLTTSLFHTVARERPAVFSSLDTLIVGGEQLELAAVRRVLAAGPPGRLVNGYGPTEAATMIAAFHCTQDSIAGLERIPVGYPLQDTILRVLDDRLRPVPVGTIGELCVAGPAVALGYLNRPDLTAQRFVRDPELGLLYRTGDEARQHPDGTFELLGRSDRQIKLRGYRIEPEEVERAATATGLVDVAFVEKAGEGPAAVLVGFVLPAPGAPPADDLPDALSRLLAADLPGYLVPARWVVVDRLPLGPAGKVDRAELMALLDHPTAAGGMAAGGMAVSDTAAGDAAVSGTAISGTAASDMPDTDGERLGEWVRGLCREVLGVGKVSDQDNFLGLGGNSITAVQLGARIEQHLAVQVEPSDILLAGRLSELTERLHARIDAATVETDR